MIDSNETVMYENGRDAGYDSGFFDGVSSEVSKIQDILFWLEEKTYKLNNKDSILAYQTVIDKIKDIWEDEL